MFFRCFHPKSKGTRPFLSCLNSKCDLLWAGGDGKGKENCCNNRTDCFLSRCSSKCSQGSVQGIWEASPLKVKQQLLEEMTSKTQLRYYSDIPILTLTRRINNCSLTVFSGVWKSPESSLPWLSLGSFINQHGDSSRALDQTHLVHGFGAEKSAYGVCTQIQLLYCDHTYESWLSCCLASQLSLQMSYEVLLHDFQQSLLIDNGGYTGLWF